MKLASNLISTLFVVLVSNPSRLFVSNVAAHGAMETPQELARRAEHINQARASLEKCAEKIHTRERIEQRLRRRNALVDQFVEMKKRDGVEISLNPELRKRDLSSKVDLKSLFPANPACVLAPELTIGPYYASNQLIRNDMREDIDGVELLLALEIIDVNTCKVVPNVMIDFWHCSNLGQYSAFAAEGTTGETFNRGLQATGSDGIATMTTIFPGWYSGRATHVHIAAHINGTISSDGDFYSGGISPHIGQLFFPESTLKEIQSNSHYAANNNTRTPNTEDNIYAQGNVSGLNPEMAIQYITEGDINAGIVATIVIGIDTSKNYSLTMSGGSGNGGPGDGTVPGDANDTSSATASTTATSTTGGTVAAIANIFTLQGLGISSILSVVLGLYLFNM
ncbi:aromatic compound dioxygenase [Terfezia boudieri ATCC MYA-4762]|uniref:Aromatic compound dioxygenase n=1 Tax=Terfezia boudieri ATCC MYA-4762 TaxID=1051890 RepID=A0A3N4M8L0_9PEZI|nr:aromatic compound dioxygenase [Terfezia boudieri ATCC MYA-4762]